MLEFEQEFVWRLVIATLLGALLGLERSLAGKHAGMRTYALVSMGSALFTMVGVVGALQFATFASINPLQLAGFVVVGIGFIGSGLAVFRGEHPVELTTAAGIWVVAGVGVAAGMGYESMALAATVLGILVFSIFARIERAIRIRWGTSYIEHE
jgi:putative Mg2+ transporter-C (MgtC) family protein